MSGEFKFCILVLIFKKTDFSNVQTKSIKDNGKARTWGIKNNHKGESASEQIVPKGIFLIECKINSKIYTWKLREKTHKCQTVNKNILFYFGHMLPFYQETHLIFISTYITLPKAVQIHWSIDVHNDNHQDLGTLVTLIMWLYLIYARLKALCQQ